MARQGQEDSIQNAGFRIQSTELRGARPRVKESESTDREGVEWQVGVWDRISQLYAAEINPRFASVVEGVIDRACLRPGERVLDLGSGTGAVATRAAALVRPGGNVLGVDISPEMVAAARQTAARLGLTNVDFSEARAETLPAPEASFDVVLASLSLMYVIDRAKAAQEIARVLRPGGRFVAAVWAGPATCDIVLFQQTAGSFAPPPPAAGVGPGALSDPAPFLAQLARAGLEAQVQTEALGFSFDDFESAWNVLAGVTAAELSPERRGEAKAAVRNLMWPKGDGPRRFNNATQFIVGRPPSREPLA
jgi:SAM-dependent methyltransferase